MNLKPDIFVCRWNYQNLYLLERSRAEYVLILSGDHIYRMDYDAMLQHHRDSGAELTVACLTVDLEQARSFGVMSVDDDDRIVSFHEKPEQPQTRTGHSRSLLARRRHHRRVLRSQHGPAPSGASHGSVSRGLGDPHV